MCRHVHIITGVLLVIALSPARARQPGDSPAPPDITTQCAVRARTLATAVHVYASTHADKLPPDLYSALLALGDAKTKDNPGALRELAASNLVSPAHAGMLAVPQEITSQWVNENSSYRYLGNGDIALSDIQDWNSIVISHLRLDAGIKVDPAPENPDGELFSLGFLDGHASVHTRAEAERLIAHSAQTLDALRDGTDPPDDRLAVRNLGFILRAVHAYAKDHAGALPPDLGATLAHVAADNRATATAAQRARIYLSPRALKSTHVPDDPTADWVNANCRYLYLGDAAISLDAIPEPETLVLVCARPDDGFPARGIDGRDDIVIPQATVSGSAAIRTKTYTDWILDQTRKSTHALKTGDALPDWVHASRDLRFIGEAIKRYAQAHAGELPPDLGATLEYLPDEALATPGPHAKAAVYLSPRAERTTHAPEAPTREWIVKNSSYIYLGSADLRLPQVRATRNPIVAHARLDEAFRMQVPGVELELVPFIDAWFGCARVQKEWLADQVAESQRQFRAVRDSRPPR